MAKVEFLDMSSTARALGMSEAAFRAHVLSGNELAFTYLSNVAAFGGHAEGEYLPPWSESTWAQTKWKDLGCTFAPTSFGNEKEDRLPHYLVSGWVGLDRALLEEVLAKRDRRIDAQHHWIYVVDFHSQKDYPLRVATQKGTPLFLSVDDIYFIKESPSSAAVVTTKKELTTHLRIIRALCEMAGVPRRGGASSIEKQLQTLGFSGPIDDTIRPILQEAFALKPD